MNEAKLQMERETNANNKEINLLKLAMAQKENEANLAYKDQSLQALNADREARREDADLTRKQNDEHFRAQEARLSGDSDIFAQGMRGWGVDESPSKASVEPLKPSNYVETNPTMTAGLSPLPVGFANPANLPSGTAGKALSDKVGADESASGSNSLLPSIDSNRPLPSGIADKMIASLSTDQMTFVKRFADAQVGDVSGKDVLEEAKRIGQGDAKATVAARQAILMSLSQKRAEEAAAKVDTAERLIDKRASVAKEAWQEKLAVKADQNSVALTALYDGLSDDEKKVVSPIIDRAVFSSGFNPSVTVGAVKDALKQHREGVADSDAKNQNEAIIAAELQTIPDAEQRKAAEIYARNATATSSGEPLSASALKTGIQQAAARVAAEQKPADKEEADFRKQMASADQAVRNAPPEKKAALRDKYDNFVVGGKSISTKIFNDQFGEGSAVTQNNVLSAVKTQIGIVKSQLADLVKARDRKLLFASTSEAKKKIEAESGVAKAQETYDALVLVAKSLELSGLGAGSAPVTPLPSGNQALDSYNALRARLPK